MKNFYQQILIILLSIVLPVSATSASKIKLTQKDFEHGTYIIDKPGVYVLDEDISFNPNSATKHTEAYFAGFPKPTQLSPKGPYDAKAFGLGFFTAILIKAHDVVLDLNQHRLEQSREHALLQRFYSNIELADQPFIPKQGPADFGDTIVSAHHVTIKNGVIGRAAHHGIHGNGGSHITIRDIRFEDFEVAAIALNGVNHLSVSNVFATNRRDVPVLGTFSNAQFIKPYIEYLFSHDSKIKLQVQGKQLNINTIRQQLREAINHVHQDIIIEGRRSIFAAAHPAEYALFHNPTGVIDGNSYGFLINQFGFAVDGFSHQTAPTQSAQHITFNNVHLARLHANVNEIVGLQKRQGEAVLDPVGALWQLKNTDTSGRPITLTSLSDNGRYKGNVLSNAQVFVAKAILHGEFAHSTLDISRANFSSQLIDWVESGQPIRKILSSYQYLCNADSMLHVNKGVIGFRFDGAKHVKLVNTSIKDIQNIGLAGSQVCGGYLSHKSHPKATLPGYGGSVVRGYSFAGTQDVLVEQATIERIRSANGLICAVDLFTDTQLVRLNNIHITHLWAGLDFTRSKINPTAPPKAVGIHIGKHAKQVTIGKHQIENLFAYQNVLAIEDESV